jgi:hypothetical protein
VFAKKGRFKKADVTKQNAEYTPVNTLVNIIQNKFPDEFAKKGRFKKADVTKQNAEYTPTVNTLVNIVQRHIKNTVKNKPWSALIGRHSGEADRVSECPQGPATPSHNPLDQVKTSEVDEAAVEVKQYEEFGEFYVLLQM